MGIAKKIYRLSHLSQHLIQCTGAMIDASLSSFPGDSRDCQVKLENKYGSSTIKVYIKREGRAPDVQSTDPPKINQKEKKTYKTSKSTQRQSETEAMVFEK